MMEVAIFTFLAFLIKAGSQYTLADTVKRCRQEGQAKGSLMQPDALDRLQFYPSVKLDASKSLTEVIQNLITVELEQLHHLASFSSSFSNSSTGGTTANTTKVFLLCQQECHM